MKTLLTVMALVLFTCSCSTPKRVSRLEGRGTRQVYNATVDQVWRATVDAAQTGDLEVVSANRDTGYIDARRRIRVHTFGENVGIWVKELAPAQTQVEVLSRQAGPPVAWVKNWENEIHRAIASNLALGTAPRETVIERGTSPSRETIVIPESRRETIVVPENRRETVIIPGTSTALRDQRLRIDALRAERQARERDLSSTTDSVRRDAIRRQIDRLDDDLKLEEQRLRELERDSR